MLTPPLKILRDALKFSGDGDLESAILILQNGLDLCEREPEHLATLPRLTSNMVLFHRRAGHWDHALSAVRRTLLLCPEDRQMLHLQADLLLESGDTSAAALVALELRAVCERNPATFSADWADALSLLEKRITG